MAVNDSLIMTSRLSSIKTVEDALEFLPDNPLRDPFADAWMYMTNHFTKYQIATFGSFVVHEVCTTSRTPDRCRRLNMITALSTYKSGVILSKNI